MGGRPELNWQSLTSNRFVGLQLFKSLLQRHHLNVFASNPEIAPVYIDGDAKSLCPSKVGLFAKYLTGHGSRLIASVWISGEERDL